MMRPQPLVSLLLLSVVLTTGCGSSLKEDPILKLSGEEALAEGKSLMEGKKYARARRYLTHAFEIAPNSRSGREALLLVADTYYLQKGFTNLIQAEAKYRDYLNRFPTSAQAAYAQFQVANSLAKRMEKPDRDQSSTLKAFNAFQELMRLYPTSEYAEQAREQIQIVEENLAEHEFIVGRFNYRFRNYPGAIDRFEFLLENYPHYTEMDKVLYMLGLTYHQSRNPEHRLKAALLFERLRTEHPDSSYISKIPHRESADDADLQEAADSEEAEDADEETTDGSGKEMSP